MNQKWQRTQKQLQRQCSTQNDNQHEQAQGDNLFPLLKKYSSQIDHQAQQSKKQERRIPKILSFDVKKSHKRQEIYEPYKVQYEQQCLKHQQSMHCKSKIFSYLQQKPQISKEERNKMNNTQQGLKDQISQKNIIPENRNISSEKPQLCQKKDNPYHQREQKQNVQKKQDNYDLKLMKGSQLTHISVSQKTHQIGIRDDPRNSQKQKLRKDLIKKSNKKHQKDYKIQFQNKPTLRDFRISQIYNKVYTLIVQNEAFQLQYVLLYLPCLLVTAMLLKNLHPREKDTLTFKFFKSILKKLQEEKVKSQVNNLLIMRVITNSLRYPYLSHERIAGEIQQLMGQKGIQMKKIIPVYADYFQLCGAAYDMFDEDVQLEYIEWEIKRVQGSYGQWNSE